MIVTTEASEPEESPQPADDSPPTGYIAVSAGTSHTCAITDAGEIECWGDRTERRTEAPRGTYKAISAGHRHSCAISTEGEIACWGSNDFGRLDAPDGTYFAIDVGRFHSCALAVDGSARCWGGTAPSPEELTTVYHHDLGAEADVRQAVPSPEGIRLADGYLDIAAGLDGTCAVTLGRELHCWGAGYWPSVSPTESFVSVVGEGERWCALSTQGQLSCWSRAWTRGFDGPDDDSFVEVAVARGHGCAIAADAQVVCWGDRFKRTGAPDGQFKSVTVGPSHACALSLSGDIACWGHLYSAAENPPTETFTALAAGNSHTCGLREDGNTRCWGSLPKIMADDLPPFASIGAGWNHICGVTNDGKAICRGYSYSHGYYHQHSGPYRSARHGSRSGRYTAVASHKTHTCAIDIDDQLACWGRNNQGQTDAPEGRYAAVAVGREFTCAITVTGRAQCWGESGHGLADPPAGTYSSIAAGWWHACGIRDSGEAVCWGRNDFGQMDVPDGTYSRISTNQRHTCAITTAGEPRCWGFNDMGQLDVPPGSYTDVVTGLNHTCALTSEGRAVCWGHGDRKATRTQAARRSEEQVRAKPPHDFAECCSFEALGAGFVTVTDRTPPNSYRYLGEPPRVDYSPDGLTRERVTVPTRYIDGYDVSEVDIWICSVHSYGDRVIIREAINDFHPVFCGDHTYWTADEDLTNWRKLLAPPPGFEERVDSQS